MCRVSVYIKEQNHCRGPIPLQIHNTTTLEQLKMKLSDEFKIPLQRQQWRSEKSIFNDETAVLRDLGIDKPGIPLYVHLTDNEGIAGNKTIFVGLFLISQTIERIMILRHELHQT